MRLAIIDLGTNSVRFDIYDILPNAKIRRVHREKQMIRLGDGVYESGKLDRSAVMRGIQSFQEFSEKIRFFSADRTVALGTAALRDAEDRDEFIDVVERHSGIRLEILAGEEEAGMIAKGVLNNERTPTGFFALVDIGGGSTEITVCHKKSILDCHSYNIGANRAQQVFLKTIPPRLEDIVELRQKIMKELKPVVESKEWPKIRTFVGSSGTVRAYSRLFRRNGLPVEPFKRKTLTRWIERLSTLTREEIAEIHGMEPKRIDLILAGGIILEELMAEFGTKSVFTTDFSLRDGILESELEKLALKFPRSRPLTDQTTDH